jgi:acyl-coenzyme A synthetase/AMP-(fatty) acid ligase
MDNILSNAGSIASYLNIGPQERAITSLPIHYSYGLSVLNSHLHSEASLVLTDRSLMDASFWQAIKTRGVTSLAGVPYTYDMLLRLGIARLDLGALHTMTQAGGRLPPEKLRLVAQACRDRNIRFFSMYGQTEATARIAYVSSELALEQAGCIGRAIPGGRLWLEDDDGQRIENAGAPGQLVYSGPNVSMGYALHWKDLAKGDENLGVLRTGDLAMRDEEGIFTITGRLSRFVKLFGVRVSLDAVEALLEEQGLSAAAFGNDDLLQVRIVRGDGIEPSEILNALSQTLGINPRAIRVDRIDSLPRMVNGKVDYGALKGMV